MTSSLDQLVAEGVLSLLRRLQSELRLSYLFITHDISSVQAMADEVIVMQSGQVVERGPRSQVLGARLHAGPPVLGSGLRPGLAGLCPGYKAVVIFSRSGETLTVTILVLPDSSLLSLAATLDPMRGANRVAGRILYRWKLVSMDGMAPVTTSGLPIAVDGGFDPDGWQDLLIVVSAFNVLSHATPLLLRAVRRAARKSRCVGGVEQGPWVLALAGLLDGREATTH